MCVFVRERERTKVKSLKGVIGRQIGSRIPASPMVPENRVIGKKTVFT
jgi:hypothetical protein